MGKQVQCIDPKCGIWFEPERPDQVFHDRACQARNAKRKDGVRRLYPAPPAIYLNPFATMMRKFKPKDALGYRLYCAELGMFLPVPGSIRRNGRRPKTNYFTVRPLEVPLVPMASAYAVHWLLPGGVVLPAHPVQYVGIGWADDMRSHGEVGKRFTEWRKNQVLSAQPSRPPLEAKTVQAGELPPHDEGDADDDTEPT